MTDFTQAERELVVIIRSGGRSGRDPTFSATVGALVDGAEYVTSIHAALRSAIASRDTVQRVAGDGSTWFAYEVPTEQVGAGALGAAGLVSILGGIGASAHLEENGAVASAGVAASRSGRPVTNDDHDLGQREGPELRPDTGDPGSYTGSRNVATAA